MRPPGPLPALRRLAEQSRRRDGGEVCELCAGPVAAEHPHIVDLDSRALLCACRACGMLFTQPGSARGRFRTVPDRYLRLPPLRPVDAQRRALNIPVDLAFVFANSRLGREVALYPSPGGATEAELDTAAWAEVRSANPLPELVADVEALLLRRTDAGVECHLVPVDACYELTGLVRQSWKGFHGGEELWARVDEFFARVADRSVPSEPAG